MNKVFLSGRITSDISRFGTDSKGGVSFSLVTSKPVIKDGQVAAQAGGGIVADSDPAAEYDESMDKVGALLQSLDPGEQIREQVR